MLQSLTLLMAQINPTVGAIEANAQKIISIIEQSQSLHEVIVFPELAITGYPPEDLLYHKEFHERVTQALDKIQHMNSTAHVIVGHPTLQGKNCYNAASVFHKGKRLAHYFKQILPTYGVFDEARYFHPGPARSCVFTINNYRLGLVICEDIWQKGPVEKTMEVGIDALICINASPFDYQKPLFREKLLQNYAKQGIALIYVNQVGGQDELVFDGQSLAYNNQGALCARAQAFSEQLLTVFMEADQLDSSVAPRLAEDALIYNALVCGTRDYIEKNKFPGVLLGLSGGIDSALTLAIAVDALGPSRVEAVMMPSRYTADISLIDAKEQIKHLGVKSQIISIETIFASFLNSLAPSFEGLPEDVTEENLQARIRGMLLMALSNKSGKLVLTTSNKSETAVGYATLYGDMAGGFAVLKDLLKTQVYQLAHYCNREVEVIPQRVIERAPSAELKPNQSDQDSLPEYVVLDAIISEIMENNSTDQLLKKGYSQELIERVTKMIQRNEYKRRQGPPGIKISARAFGRDWRYPITKG